MLRVTVAIQLFGDFGGRPPLGDASTAIRLVRGVLDARRGSRAVGIFRERRARVAMSSNIAAAQRPLHGSGVRRGTIRCRTPFRFFAQDRGDDVVLERRPRRIPIGYLRAIVGIDPAGSSVVGGHDEE